MTGRQLHVGVDGGGSTCRVRVTDGSGIVLASAEGGSANVYLDFERALATIEQTVDRIFTDLGATTAEKARCQIGLGLAGVSSCEIGDRVAARLRPRFGKVTVSNDAVIACLGAHAGADGGLVIAGTGSAAMLRLGGHEINIGGRGFLLGDDGSGAVMSRQAWRRALRAHDGLEPATPLLRSLMAEFDDDPVAVIAWGRVATSGQFGAYTPLIVKAAADRDPVALTILQDAGEAIGELVEALMRRGAPRVSLAGGLAAPLQPYIAETTRAHLSPPLLDALDGALLLTKTPLLANRE